MIFLKRSVASVSKRWSVPLAELVILVGGGGFLLAEGRLYSPPTARFGGSHAAYRWRAYVRARSYVRAGVCGGGGGGLYFCAFVFKCGWWQDDVILCNIQSKILWMSNTDGACVLAYVYCVCDTFMCVCVMWVMIRPFMYYVILRYCGCPIQGCIWKSKDVVKKYGSIIMICSEH